MSQASLPRVLLVPVLLASLWAAGCARSAATPETASLAEDQTAAACVNLGSAPTARNDVLFRLFATATSCPTNVRELRQLLQADGLASTPTLVANRGFHNAAAGSFSFFELVSGQSRATGIDVGTGEFFFGHFTGADAGGVVGLDQTPRSGSLMVELIVWDPGAAVYNFYELIGQGSAGAWFYRGDSLDIMADVANLHRQPDPARPQFGRNLRCSGCHTNGGPIMKELAAPHNDWWRTQRPTPLAPNRPDAEVGALMRQLVDADVLAQAVRAGNDKLKTSPTYAAALSGKTLQERLRPLFCPQEVNLESDGTPAGLGADVDVPAAFFVDPRLATATLTLPRAAYGGALARLRSRFPETNTTDGDHAWLTPVKAASDAAAVEIALADQIIDEEFVADVLAVDFTHPVTSPARCGLLRLLPATGAAGWQQTFLANLESAGTTPARALAANLSDPTRTADFHQQRAAALLSACASRLATTDDTESFVRLLDQRRQEIFANELSKNRLGQIFEPGFRVIFPAFQPQTRPGTYVLSDTCVVTPAGG